MFFRKDYGGCHSGRYSDSVFAGAEEGASEKKGYPVAGNL